MILFFDTSALVRRYDALEPGADRVRMLCDSREGNVIYITELTPIEIASAFSRKLREGRINITQRELRWRAFRRHRRGQYRMIMLDNAIRAEAQRLVFAHPLRAYDAVQVASALRARQLLPAGAPDFQLVTADRAQARAAAAEGLAVELVA